METNKNDKPAADQNLDLSNLPKEDFVDMVVEALENDRKEFHMETPQQTADRLGVDVEQILED